MKFEFKQELSKEIFEKKYMINGESTVDDVFRGVAKEISLNEEDNVYWEELFYNEISSGRLLPAGRILANARPNSTLKNFGNCFVIGIDDSIESISKANTEYMSIQSVGGGVGLSISKLRPEGASISKGGESTGPLSFMKIFDTISQTIKTGGSRRAATLISMHISHPDIERFITCKRGDENKEYTNINISVGITNKFLQHVKDDLDWNLEFNGEVYKTVKARYLYDLLTRNAFDYAEPGVLNLDTINDNNNGMFQDDYIVATNPCQPEWATVLTKEGVKQFKDVNIGDFIWSKEGWTKIINKQCTGVKNVWKYKTSYPDEEYGTFYGTKNHRIVCDGDKIEVGLADAIDIFMEDYCKDTIDDYPWVYSIEDSEATKRTMRFQIDFAEYVSTEEVYSITVDNDSHTYWTGGCNVSNCGELPLPDNSMCLLSALNLTKFVIDAFEDTSRFDFNSFYNSIPIAVRFLDDALDRSEFTLDNIKNKALGDRRIGLGFTGLADAMAMLRIKYGSKESIEFTEKISKYLRDYSYGSSIQLSIEKGSFPNYNDTFLDYGFINKCPSYFKASIKKHGIRNIDLNSIAPTGTISLSLGNNCSSGIEPIFSLEYDRRVLQPDGSFKISKVFDYAWMLYKEKFNTDVVPDYFVTTEDISAKQQVDIQATAQKYIGSAISKTVNLSSGTTFEEYQDLFMYAMDNGCKGLTVFNPNGKLKGILLKDSKEEEDRKSKKRPKILECDIYEMQVDKQRVIALVGLLDSHPYEVFITRDKDNVISMHNAKKGLIQKVKSGRYDLHFSTRTQEYTIENISNVFNGDWGSLSRLISISLRHRVDLQFIVAQLNKDYSFGTFSKGMARVLKKYILDGEAVIGHEVCPDCGSTLIYVEGCKSCSSQCGWSKCG